MKPSTASSLFILASLLSQPGKLLFAQSTTTTVDTVWLDESGRRLSNCERAYSFRLPRQKSWSGYRQCEYYLNGTIKQEVVNTDGNVQDNYYTHFDKKGFKVLEGRTLHGSREGKWYQYHRGKCYQEADFKYGVRHGLFLQYYVGTDQLYRYGVFFLGVPDGVFKTYYSNGSLKRLDYYDGGRVVDSGKCFDSRGQLMAYTPYVTDPIFCGDVNGQVDKWVYAATPFRSDLWAAYTAFRFSISPEGTITKLQFFDPDARNRKHIRRLINHMNCWQPMVADGCAVQADVEAQLCVWNTGARLEMHFTPSEDVLSR